MIASLIDRFTEQWQQLGGSWEYWENATSARLALLRYLQAQNRTELLAWEADTLAIPHLQEALADAGITLLHPHRRHLSPDVAMGLTAADAALADSGSLVLTPAPGRSWLPALIPIRHVALLPAERLYADLGAWRRHWLSARPQDVARSLIISGPSFSDDIELHHHRGMFGPRYTHVILYRSQ